MQYIFHLFADEAAYEALPSDQREAGFNAYMAYTQALKDAGVYVGGDRLRPVGRVDASSRRP